MPTQMVNDGTTDNTEIRVKAAYNGEVMITYIDPHVTIEQLSQEMRDICRFPPDQVCIFIKNCYILKKILKIKV